MSDTNRIHGAPVDYSDLWHGDGARDWAGHEYDCSVEPRPEEVDQWREQAERARFERERSVRHGLGEGK